MPRARSLALIALVCGVAFMPAHAACGGRVAPGSAIIDVPSSGSCGGVSWTSDGRTLDAQNGVIALSFDESSGSLVGLENLATGTQLLADGTHASLAAAIDPTTSDPWSATDTSWWMQPALERISVSSCSTSATFDLVFDLSAAVEATQHVTLVEGSPLSQWTTDLTVASGSSAVALAIRSPRIAGVPSLADHSLAWPWHEGAVLSHDSTQPSATGDDAMRVVEYPTPASMQWTALYDSTEGLYYGVEDTTGSFKELRFGRDPADPGAGRELSVAFWPYVTPGGTFNSSVVDVGVSDATGWYWGGDYYRTWLRDHPEMLKTIRAPFEQTLPGWHKSYNQNLDLDAAPYTYCDVPTVLHSPSYVSSTGIGTLAMYGWSYEGLDRLYPDYDWLSAGDAGAPSCLQESSLAASVHTLHASGDHVLFYLNALSADPQRSAWYATSGATAAATLAGGSVQDHTYDPPYNNALRAVCPSTRAWQDQLSARAAALRSLDRPTGADGVYWDQLTEVAGLRCYDATHGHANPRSAFIEGDTALLERLSSEFSGANGDSGYLFGCEGISDYYARWIDVMSPEPGRLLGYVPAHTKPPSTCANDGSNLPCGAAHAPDLARYVISAKILGLQTQASSIAADGGDGAQDAYAWAFILAEPLRSNEWPDSPNAYALPRYPNIYAAEPEIYFQGEFDDAKGLAISLPVDQILASAIVGSRRDRVGVQLWNRTDTNVTVDVVVDLASLRTATRAGGTVVDIEGGAAPPFTQTGSSVKMTVAVNAHDVRALKVQL